MTTLWGGFVINTSHGQSISAAIQDTALTSRQLVSAMAPLLLPLFHAYEPRWFMKDVHLNPAEAVLAHQDLKAEQSIGAHYGTFQLTLEGIDTPIETLRQEMTEAGIPQSVFYRGW